MSEEKLRLKLQSLPKEHPPRHYTVILTDRKGCYLDTRYVRASSKVRAEITGYMVNRFTFNNKKTFNASAGETLPLNTKEDK